MRRFKMTQAVTYDDVQLIPRFSNIASRSDCKTNTKFTRNFSIETPLVAAPMDTICEAAMMLALAEAGAVGCLHRFMTIEDQVAQIKSITPFLDKSVPVCASIGVSNAEKDRALQLLDTGVNVLLIDVAHGHHANVGAMMAWLNALSNRSKFDVIAGNIATAAGAAQLQAWGADALRVGIGGGSMCETRIRTGVGIPQLTALDSVLEVAEVPVINDGGIRFPGDVAKALACGADSVMIGSLFAGTNETPGNYFVTGKWPNEKRMKVYRGSASESAKTSTGGVVSHVEGASRMVPTKGSVYKVIKDIMDGVTSSMSYLGAHTLQEFQAYAEFVQISNAGLIEAHPHGLEK